MDFNLTLDKFYSILLFRLLLGPISFNYFPFNSDELRKSWWVFGSGNSFFTVNRFLYRWKNAVSMVVDTAVIPQASGHEALIPPFYLHLFIYTF